MSALPAPNIVSMRSNHSCGEVRIPFFPLSCSEFIWPVWYLLKSLSRSYKSRPHRSHDCVASKRCLTCQVVEPATFLHAALLLKLMKHMCVNSIVKKLGGLIVLQGTIFIEDSARHYGHVVSVENVIVNHIFCAQKLSFSHSWCTSFSRIYYSCQWFELFIIMSKNPDWIP